MTSRPSSDPPSGKYHLSTNTKIGLTIPNLASIVVVVGLAVVMYMKIPDEEKVQSISSETAQAFHKQSVEERAKLSTRIDQLESAYSETSKALIQMNNRMDQVLILLASSGADRISSPEGRRAAEQVRKNIKADRDPLSGLGLEKD